MLRFPSLAIGLAVASVLLACGDDGGGGGGGGGGADGNDGTGGSGASGATGAGGAGGHTQTDYAGYGYVSVYSYAMTVAGMPFVASGAYANYTLAGGSAQAAVCTVEEVGDCSVSSCEIRSGVTIQPTNVSAGRVTISGGQRTIELLPEADASYPTDQSTTMGIFDGGETLTFTVDGAGDVPAHQATLTAPGAVTVTAPDLASPPTIDRATDLALSWSGGSSGELQAAITVAISDGVEVTQSVGLVCRFPASSSSASIPAGALGLLPATAPTTTATMSLLVVSRTELEAGDYLVGFDAAAAASTTEGAQASSQITLQ